MKLRPCPTQTRYPLTRPTPTRPTLPTTAHDPAIRDARHITYCRMQFQVIFGNPCLGNLRCPRRQPHPARSGRPGRSSTISYSYHPYHPYTLCITGGFRDEMRPLHWKIPSPCVLDIARTHSSQLRCQIHPGPPYSMWASHDSLC